MSPALPLRRLQFRTGFATVLLTRLVLMRNDGALAGTRLPHHKPADISGEPRSVSDRAARHGLRREVLHHSITKRVDR
jgi:hypothetical protein